MNAPRPLVPEDLHHIPARHARSLMHAAFAALRSVAENRSPVAVCRALYPSDEGAVALLGGVSRAAISGATTSTPGWAAELVGRATAGFYGSLVPRSAAAELIRRGPPLVPLTGMGPTDVPVLAAPITVAPWVAESGAIPLRSYTLGLAPLDPKKLAVLVVMSVEMARHSGASQVFDALLRQVAAMSLDSAYFSTAAASSSAHAGLLNGVTPTTITAGATLADVLAALAAAVSGPGSSGEVVFIASAARAAAASLRAPEFTATVLPSAAVPADRVIAVDPQSLVHGHGGDPDIGASTDAVLNMADPALQIGTPGSPATVAAPSQSMFQTAQIAMRMLLDVAFAKTRADAVAYADLTPTAAEAGAA